jgi:hypothetical protein
MRVTVFDDDGKALDAAVDIGDETITVHSRGGAFGKPNLRNPDHRRALRTILARLARSSFTPTGVWLDSGRATQVPEEDRQLITAAEFRQSIDELVREIGIRGAAWGRPDGAAGHGNSTKRIKVKVPGATALKLAGIVSRASGSISPSAAPPKIIYFNVGWMREYAGPKSDDPTIGAHGYLATHKHGAESYNFVPTPDGIVRGYRPPGDRDRTNITRLGASSSDEYIDGVLVVWLAKEPESGTTLIVGWYRDARVYRDAREGADVNGERHHYTAEASAKNAILLRPEARTFTVPSSRLKPGDGFGQKPTWYGSDETNARVWDYIKSWSVAKGPSERGAPKKPPKNADPELRRKVERAAVEHAIAYYQARFGPNCEIDSVEVYGKGWDLEVRNGSDPLLVEVKGLLKGSLVCELTPNEFEKMLHPDNQDRYVVYVVNNALAEPPAVPIASIFAHVGEGVWQAEDGRKLTITPRTAAVLSCTER